MNSVDTGWVNDENPLEAAARIARENNFQVRESKSIYISLYA